MASTSEVEPANSLGNLPDDSVTVNFKNVACDTDSNSINDFNDKDTSDKGFNFEMATSVIETKISTVLGNIIPTNAVKLEDFTSETSTDDAKPTDDKDAINNNEFNSGLTSTSKKNTVSALECQSGMSTLKIENFISKTHVDNTMPAVNIDSSSNRGLNFESPTISEGSTDIAPGIPLISNTKNDNNFYFGKSVECAKLATNEDISVESEFCLESTQNSTGSKQDTPLSNSPEEIPIKFERFKFGVPVDNLTSDFDKDTLSETGNSFIFEHGGKSIIALDDQSDPNTFKIKNLAFGIPFDNTKPVSSDTIFQFGKIQSSFGDNRPFSFANPSATSIKELGTSFTGSATKYAKPDTNRNTAFCVGFNFESASNTAGGKSKPVSKNSPTKSAVKFRDFTSAIPVNTNSDTNTTASKIGFLPITSPGKSISTFGDPTGTNKFKFGNSMARSKPNIAKTDTRENTIFNPAFPQLKPTSFEGKSAIPLQNSSACNTRELGCLFRGFAAENTCAVNKDTSLDMEIDLRSTPIASGEKLTPASLNLHASKTVNFGGFTSVDTPSITSFNIGLPSTSSLDKPCSVSQTTSANLKSFTLGSINTDEKIQEKSSGNLGNFTFGSVDSNKKLPEMTGNSAFTFGRANTFTGFKELSSRDSGVSSLDFLNTNAELQAEASENLGGFTVGFVNTNQDVPAPPGTAFKFCPTYEVDTMTQTKTVTTRHQCINMMDEYSQKCLEELRLEDYKENRKGLNSVVSTSQTEGPSFTNFFTTSVNATIQTPVINSITTSANAISQAGGLSGMNSITVSTNTSPQIEELPVTSSITTANTLQMQELPVINFTTTPVDTNTAQSNFQFVATETTGVSKLLQGLENLLLSGKNSDVTLNVQGKEFHVHKNILEIWSPFLLAKIENENKENTSGVVNIDDCNPESFSNLLHFLYTGSTKKFSVKKALDLYSIANKYQVPDLSKVCINYMKYHITLQNFCDILTLSLQYDERELYDVATYFFIKNSTEILVTGTWELFLNENPVEGNELVLKALRQPLNNLQQSVPAPLFSRLRNQSGLWMPDSSIKF